MKRRTLTATTVIIALTAAMLFAGVVNAQQPATATAQNIAHTSQDVHGTTSQVLGTGPAAGNDISAYCCGHHWGGCCHHHRC